MRRLAEYYAKLAPPKTPARADRQRIDRTRAPIGSRGRSRQRRPGVQCLPRPRCARELSSSGRAECRLHGGTIAPLEGRTSHLDRQRRDHGADCTALERRRHRCGGLLSFRSRRRTRRGIAAMTGSRPWRFAPAAAALLGGCGDNQSVLNPKGPEAASACAPELAAVRVRDGRAPARRPRHGRGDPRTAAACALWLASARTVVWAGIVFPAVTLTALLGYGVWLTRASTAVPGGDGALRIEVVGEQWWWRVTYPQRRRSTGRHRQRDPHPHRPSRSFSRCSPPTSSIASGCRTSAARWT